MGSVARRCPVANCQRADPRRSSLRHRRQHATEPLDTGCDEGGALVVVLGVTVREDLDDEHQVEQCAQAIDLRLARIAGDRDIGIPCSRLRHCCSPSARGRSRNPTRKCCRGDETIVQNGCHGVASAKLFS